MDENFSAVIQAHTDFVMKLVNQISQGNKPNVDTSRVRRNDLCAVGRWLSSIEGEFGHLPEFKKLMELHSSFHAEAADVLEQNADDNDFNTMMKLNELTLVGGKSSQMMTACYDFLMAIEKSGHDPNKYKLSAQSEPDMSFS